MAAKKKKDRYPNFINDRVYTGASQAFQEYQIQNNENKKATDKFIRSFFFIDKEY